MSAGVVHFEGTCDVCGETFFYDWHTAQGIIDYGIDDDGFLYTWVRHYASAAEASDPKCAIYSSLLRQVRDGSQMKDEPAPAPDATVLLQRAYVTLQALKRGGCDWDLWHDAEAEWTVEALGEFLWPDGAEPVDQP